MSIYFQFTFSCIRKSLQDKDFFMCAGGENRTLVLWLEARYSATKLHPQIVGGVSQRT